MAQIRQCLTFMLKSLDQSLGQEPGLDELDCHDMVEVAANPLALVNGPHAATPDDVDDAIFPDPFGRRLILDHRSGHAGLQSGIGICCQQRFQPDRKSARLNSSHSCASRMPSSACKK